MATVSDPLVDVDRLTGEFISGWPRIKQSILCILTTRLKTRLMRLWWGSEFLDMQDKPGTEEVFLTSIFAAAEAIDQYEPEFKVTSIQIPEWGVDGAIQIVVIGTDLTTDQQNRLVALF